jgi:hypothetical protein
MAKAAAEGKTTAKKKKTRAKKKVTKAKDAPVEEVIDKAAEASPAKEVKTETYSIFSR